jgi:hypothetical protein
MQLDGRYARLFRMQAAAYTGEAVELEPDEAVSARAALGRSAPPGL